MLGQLTPNGWNMRFNHQKTRPDVKGTRMKYRFPTFYRPTGSHEACETLWNCQPSQHWRLGDEWLGWESACVTFPWCPIWLPVGGNHTLAVPSMESHQKKWNRWPKRYQNENKNDSNMFIHFQNGGFDDTYTWQIFVENDAKVQPLWWLTYYMARKTGAVMLCLCRYACIILWMGEVSVVAQTSEKESETRHW